MIQVQKNKDQARKRRIDLRSFVNPKVAVFLSSVPFMLLCPFTISVILFGWPIDVWNNNQKADLYQQTFEMIKLPADTYSVSDTVTKITNINSENGKCDIYSSKVIASKYIQDELASLILKEYQELVAKESEKEKRIDGFDYLFNSKVKLFELNKDENIFNNGELNINLSDYFGISNLEGLDETPYLLYMIQTEAFSSRDSRCFGERVEVEEVDNN